ncbi:FHA domain-containing protein [Actinoallomurus spadix]|uniref:FHA domain-containing protein n=1 Tax=Actinoallomurus spadix TaxID=79912 RepID=A0ABN0XBB5_9ACTN|nr:FHA domain-containing protein [Actinoallomurus spadix]MCO5987764.1 FHA domain-containing protein [Actinoallomurus spadix]
MPNAECARCGHTNPDGARFCSSCGTPLTGEAPPFASEPGASTSTMSLSAIQAAVEAEQDEGPPIDHGGAEALPPGTALLLVKGGPNAGSRFLLDRDTTTAGRHPQSDIFLDDVTVSRKHVEFFRRDGRFSIRDAGSLNGTYVNRERVDETVLSSGDEVQIGKFRLVYVSNAPLTGVPAGAAASEPPAKRSRWSLWRRR